MPASPIRVRLPSLLLLAALASAGASTTIAAPHAPEGHALPTVQVGPQVRPGAVRTPVCWRALTTRTPAQQAQTLLAQPPFGALLCAPTPQDGVACARAPMPAPKNPCQARAQ